MYGKLSEVFKYVIGRGGRGKMLRLEERMGMIGGLGGIFWCRIMYLCLRDRGGWWSWHGRGQSLHEGWQNNCVAILSALWISVEGVEW